MRHRQLSAILMLAVGLPIVLAGCGSGSTGTSSTTNVQSNGSVKWAVDMTTQTGYSGDPTSPNNQSLGVIQRLVYDSLLRADGNDRLHPGLADSIVATDPTTVTINLHAGLKFTDGTPLDAAAVQSTINRDLKSKQGVSFNAVFFKSIDQTRIDSPTKLTVLLKTPTAGALIHEFAYQAGEIPSPTAIQNGVDLSTHPVGAGPFIAQSWDPSKQMIMTRNPNYFQASQIKVGRIEIDNVTNGASMVNALLSGAYDIAGGSGMVPQYLDPFRNQPNFHVIDIVNPNYWTTTSLCLSVSPFQDVRVRQALYWSIDTTQLNQIAYEGKGELWSQFWPSSSPLYDASIKNPYQPRNVAKAKQLLADAGIPNPKFSVIYGPTGTSPQIFAFLQQEWKEAGFDVTGYPTLSAFSEYYSANKVPTHGQAFTPQGGSMGLDKLRFFTTNDYANPCNNGDSTIRGILAQLQATDPNNLAAQKALWSQASAWQWSNLNNLWFLWAAHGIVYDNRLAGVAYTPDWTGALWPDFHSIYVKA